MKKSIIAVIGLLSIMLTSCENKKNPLTEPWNTPFGIAPFSEIKAEHYKPAIMQALKEHNDEIQAIINNPEEPNFENTIVALDNAGGLFNRVYGVFSNETSINSTPELMAIEMEMSPIVSAHFNEISMNENLFNRVKAVYEKRESLGLEPDQMRLLTETYKDYERSGATLSEEAKAELKEINAKISELELLFEQHILKETGEYNLVIDNENDLAGLSENQIASAAARAKDKGMEGWWVFGLDNPSLMPFLQSADNRDLRIKLNEAYLNVGNNNNENDNKQIVIDLIRLRDRKAQIMGFDNYAQYVLVERMAKTPEAVYDLLNRLWTPALKVAKQEYKDLKALAKKDGVNGELAPGDWRYYFEKSKASKFNLSEDEIRPYLQYSNVRDGIFYVANKLYGITFTQLENVPVPHPEAEAFECKDADGSHLGVIFMDMFARPPESQLRASNGNFSYSTQNWLSAVTEIVTSSIP